MIPVRATLHVQTNLPNAKLKIQTNRVQNDVSIDTQINVVGGTPYPGPYTVTPTRSTQVLNTNTFLMIDNVTVDPIPPEYGLVTWDGSVLTVS